MVTEKRASYPSNSSRSTQPQGGVRKERVDVDRIGSGEGGKNAGYEGGGGVGVGCVEDAVAEIEADGLEDSEEAPRCVRR